MLFMVLEKQRMLKILSVQSRDIFLLVILLFFVRTLQLCTVCLYSSIGVEETEDSRYEGEYVSERDKNSVVI